MSGTTSNDSLSLHATSPAGMAATENDYTGATGSFARLTPNAAGTVITGFASGVNGRILTIVNLGNANITVLHQDNGSVAANRVITIGGAALVLPSDVAASFIYDSTTQRWRQIS